MKNDTDSAVLDKKYAEHQDDLQEFNRLFYGLQRLSVKPEMFEYMKQVLPSTSFRAFFDSQSAADDSQKQLRPDTQSAISRNGGEYGSLTLATAQAVEIFGTQTYQIRDIVKAMQQDGYVFRARDPRVAVNGAMARLVSAGKVTIVEQGFGNNPTTFRNRTESVLQMNEQLPSSLTQ